MFIKKLFRFSSESLQIFKGFKGLKFRFEVLNVFIVKVNVLIDKAISGYAETVTGP